MIRVAITAIALCIAGVAKAQTYVPPVFGADSLNIHTDEMTRLYVPPQKVMWISNDSLVSNAEVLLLPGTGQAELGRKNMCSMHTTKSDTASILLDYGRELHGGLKLVLGSAKPWRTASVRIRFGESVSEAPVARMMAANGERDIPQTTMPCVIWLCRFQVTDKLK